MTLIGLELNATRARAVAGPLGEFPCPLPLEPPTLDLPLVLSLERFPPAVGGAGLRLLRQMPHLACHGFLPHIGEPNSHQSWSAGRHKVDGTQALVFVLQRLQKTLHPCSGIVLTLPSYLGTSQVEMIQSLAAKAGLPVQGTLSVPLAAALAAYAEQSWFGTVVVADCDDYGLTLSTIATRDGQAQLVETRLFPHLNLGIWKERLLNSLADCCVWQSRRDPRGSPQAEQSLYEQLENVFDACWHNRPIQLGLQANQWYQNLFVQPEQAVAFCAGLIQQVLSEVESLWRSPWPEGTPAVLLVTSTVGRLPGVVPALRAFFEEWANWFPRHGFPKKATGLHEDFGEDLFRESSRENATVVILSEDAPARASHGLLPLFQRGELSRGHLDTAPLPLPQPVEAGPARLHYQGQDYWLNDPTFTLGRQAGCHIVFDGESFRNVAARHCDIIFDHRTFMLFDRSHDGTMVNESRVSGSVVLRPGDWIQLGPDGPILRFLGQTFWNGSPLMTTA